MRSRPLILARARAPDLFVDVFRGRGRFVARELLAPPRLRVDPRPFVRLVATRRFVVVRFVVFLAGFLAVRFVVFFAGFLAVFVVRFRGAALARVVDRFRAVLFLTADERVVRFFVAARRRRGSGIGTYGGQLSSSYLADGTAAYSGCSSSTPKARRPARHAAMRRAPKPYVAKKNPMTNPRPGTSAPKRRIPKPAKNAPRRPPVPPRCTMSRPKINALAT
jgi:hypothetical protein